MAGPDDNVLELDYCFALIYNEDISFDFNCKRLYCRARFANKGVEIHWSEYSPIPVPSNNPVVFGYDEIKSVEMKIIRNNYWFLFRLNKPGMILRLKLSFNDKYHRWLSEFLIDRGLMESVPEVDHNRLVMKRGINLLLIGIGFILVIYAKIRLLYVDGLPEMYLGILRVLAFGSFFGLAFLLGENFG